MLPVTAHADPVAREDIALALSVVLIGLLMMVTRRNAVSQVVGFLSLENGVNLAATGAQGMPLVVEISVAFSILIAFIVIGIFLFRIRERFDTVDLEALDAVPRGTAMNRRTLTCDTPACGGWSRLSRPASILLVPLVAAALLSLIADYRLSARINVAGLRLCRLLAALLRCSGRSPRRRPVPRWSTTSTSSSSCSTPSSASPPARSAPATSATNWKPAASRRTICVSTTRCSSSCCSA